jgi:hypothetical protein
MEPGGSEFPATPGARKITPFVEPSFGLDHERSR